MHLASDFPVVWNSKVSFTSDQDFMRGEVMEYCAYEQWSRHFHHYSHSSILPKLRSLRISGDQTFLPFTLLCTYSSFIVGIVLTPLTSTYIQLHSTICFIYQCYIKKHVILAMPFEHSVH